MIAGLPQDSNPITDITHSPLYPLILLTIYLFGIGFTIGNYAGYIRFNTHIFGDSFARAYLAFAVLGAGAYFLVSGVAWLWAAKYVTTVESRIRKLTLGFAAIFLFHDLPCFSMELHAILEYGWLNGYQGFVFVVQIITFLISFTNGWMYYTWVMAGWCQLYYGYPHESYQLKTGNEPLQILPPMSPAEGLHTPVLGSGLRWNSSTGLSQPSASHHSQHSSQQQQQHTVQTMMSSPVSARSSNLAPRMSVPRLGPGSPRSVAGASQSAGGGGGGPGSGIRAVRPIAIDGLEDDMGPPSRQSSVAGGVHNGDPFAGGNPPSLMTSNAPSPSWTNRRGGSVGGGGGGAPRPYYDNPHMRSPGSSWRNLPTVGGGGGGGGGGGAAGGVSEYPPNVGGGPVMWSNRKSLL